MIETVGTNLVNTDDMIIWRLWHALVIQLHWRQNLETMLVQF